MVFFNLGSLRLPNMPDALGSSSSQLGSRFSGTRQPRLDPPSRVSSANPNRQSRVNALATANLASEPRMQPVRTSLDLPFDQVSFAFTTDATLPAGSQPLSAGVYRPASSTSLASSVPSALLPAELQALLDPDVPVNLPPPGRLIGASTLDNRQLDKLVAALGRNRATWRRALLLYEWLQDSGHAMDDRLCTTLIRVCAEHGQAVHALNVYEWMRAPAAAGGGALAPTVYTYTAAMRAALTGGLLERALGVWRDVQAARCRPDCRLAITYIEVCSRLGMVDAALNMYADMIAAPPGSKLSPTVHAYTAAMRAATEGGRWPRALDIWGDMRAAGVPPTGHAYAAVISACASGYEWPRAVALFEEMCNSGIRPDVVSCTALVTALAAAGQYQRAESVVQWMLGYGLKPNVRTYTALLTALGNGRQWERAVEMLHLMQTPEWGSVQPNAYSYSALLKALGEHGQWQLAEALFSHLEGKARATTGDASAAAPAAAAAAASAAAAAAAAAVPSAAGGAAAPASGGTVGPDATSTSSGGSWTSAAQLNGLDLGPSVAAAAAAASSAAAATQSHFSLFSGAATPATSGHLTAALSHSAAMHEGSSAASCASNASDLVQQLSRPSRTPSPAPATAAASSASGGAAAAGGGLINEVVCGALMLAYERAGKWEEAVRVLRRAAALGIEPNTVMLNTAISAAGKAGQMDVAEAIFRQVREPDAMTYEVMIAAHGMAGNAAAAEASFRSLTRAGFRPRDFAYCGLIAAHSIAGDLPAALNVRARMLQDRVALTVHVYNALMAACERSLQFDRALELFGIMQRDGVEPNAVTKQVVASIGKKGAALVENQQITAAAMSAVMAAAGTLLMRTGMF